MDYRSDVKLCVSNEGFEKIKNLDVIGYADDINVRHKDRIVLSWNNIEWNENVPKIKELMDILKEKQFSYNFIRVGEEFMNLGADDDIEKKICIITEKDRNIFYGLRTIITIKEDSEVLYLKRMKRMLENCCQE